MRAVISFVVVAVTVVFQLTVVDRIAFPGGAGPDLVLLVVAALALAGGPMAGVLTGFLAGLALDVAPPGSHFVGQNALVFCLVGYLCGLLADDASGDAEQGHTALFEIVVTAAGAVCGEALLALLGVMLSDPRVTWPAITNVLPAAVAYDVLLCPFVLYAVAAALRLGGARGEGRRVGWSPSQARTPVSGREPGRDQAAGRRERAAAAAVRAGQGAGLDRRPARPGRRTADREARAPAQAGTARDSGPRPAWARRSPRPGSARARPGSGSAAAAARACSAARCSAARDPGAEAVRPGSAPPGSAPAGLGGIPRFGSSSMGRSLLGGSVFSRKSSSSLRRPAVFGRSAPLGLASPLRHRGNPAGGGLTGHAPRFSQGSSLTRLTSALRRSAGPKSPGRGWLRGTSSRGAFPRRGSLLGRARRGHGQGQVRRPPSPGRARRLAARRLAIRGRSGSARLGSAGLGSSRLGSSGLGSGRLGISRFGSSSMGRSLLGGSVFSRKSSSSLSRPAVFGRSAPLGLTSPLRHRGNPAGGGLTGHAPRFSQGSSLTRLTSALRRSAGPKAPGRGWLRGASSRRGSLDAAAHRAADRWAAARWAAHR